MGKHDRPESFGVEHPHPRMRGDQGWNNPRDESPGEEKHDDNAPKPHGFAVGRDGKTVTWY